MTSRSPAEEEAWRYIAFRLENDPGFWFGLIAGNDRRPRKRLRDRAEAWCRANGVAFHEHTRPPGELRMVAVELSRDPEKGLHWIHADGPSGLASEWDAGAKAMLMAMNERRDAYRRHLQAGLIVDGRVSLKPILRDFAPDMFSIRAFVSELGADQMEPLPAVVRPATYFLMPATEVAESIDSLLNRADRLATIDDHEAGQIRVRALMTAFDKLLAAGRWSEAADTAERLMRDPVVVGTDREHAVSVYAHAARIVSTVPSADPGTTLRRIRALMSEAIILAEGDTIGGRSVPLSLLSLCELSVLERLRRWDEIPSTLTRLARLLSVSDPTSPFSPLPAVLPGMITASHTTAAELRRDGKQRAASATVDLLMTVVEEARRKSPDDPRWALEQAQASLLRIDDLLSRSDSAGALNASNEVLALADEHADLDSGSWSHVRRAAQVGRMVALTAAREWEAVANIASSLLDQSAKDTETDSATLWGRAYVAAVAAACLKNAGRAADLLRAVDSALGATMGALATGGSDSVQAVSALMPELFSALLRTIPTSPHELTDEYLGALAGRARRARWIFAALLARLPTRPGAAALADMVTLEAHCDALKRAGRGVRLARATQVRLRRQARAIRRWREGSRLPPFVLRLARQPPPP